MKLYKVTWILISGILLVRMALFMSYPFLAIYLEELHFSPIEIGAILGSHYFFAGISGTLGGSIADQWKPKQMIIISLLIGAISFFGLSQSESFLSFLFFNCTLAISTSTFEPIVSMMITANTPKELHTYTFRCRYLAINIGAAIGPMIGILLISKGSSFSFLVTASFLIFYNLLFSLLKMDKQKKEPNLVSRSNIKEALSYMSNHSAFLSLIAANIFVTITYGQIFSTLPQILNQRFEESRHLYLILLTINPIIVTSVCLFFNNALSKKQPKDLFRIGSLLLSIAFLGFELSATNHISYIFFMILFTLAEILLIPTTSKYLFDLAPDKFKGAYLGSESSSYLGFFIGNLIGGLLLQSGYSVFLFCSGSAIAGFVCYRMSYKNTVLSSAVVLE